MSQNLQLKMSHVGKYYYLLSHTHTLVIILYQYITCTLPGPVATRTLLANTRCNKFRGQKIVPQIQQPFQSAAGTVPAKDIPN